MSIKYNIFLLIKDSLFNYAEIIDKDSNKEELIKRLELIIIEKNDFIKKEINRPNSMMESKFPEYRFRPYEFKKIENEYTYTDGTTRYWIEQI